MGSTRIRRLAGSLVVLAAVAIVIAGLTRVLAAPPTRDLGPGIVVDQSGSAAPTRSPAPTGRADPSASPSASTPAASASTSAAASSSSPSSTGSSTHPSTHRRAPVTPLPPSDPDDDDDDDDDSDDD